MADDVTDSAEMQALRDSEPTRGGGIHTLIAWLAGGLVVLNIVGALYGWTNALLATDVDGMWWRIHDAFALSIVASPPFGLYAIASFHLMQGKGMAGRLDGLTCFIGATKHAATIVGIGMLLFVAAIASGAIAIIAGGSVDYVNGDYVTTSHGTITGESTRWAYVFTKWMFGAAGNCAGAMFCAIGLAAAIAMASRRRSKTSGSNQTA